MRSTSRRVAIGPGAGRVGVAGATGRGGSGWAAGARTTGGATYGTGAAGGVSTPIDAAYRSRRARTCSGVSSLVAILVVIWRIAPASALRRVGTNYREET